MSVHKRHARYISGSVNSTPGTFAHNLGRKPWMVIPVPVGTAAGTVCDITYDTTNSDAKNVVLVGESATYVPFRAILIDGTE
jgi:hypothetical protein